MKSKIEIWLRDRLEVVGQAVIRISKAILNMRIVFIKSLTRVSRFR